MPSIDSNPFAVRATVLLLVVWPTGRALAQGWIGRDRLQAERCEQAAGDGAPWLVRADSVTGLAGLADRILSFRATDSDRQFYQSDRMYPPFIGQSVDRQHWFDPTTGTERLGVPPNAGPSGSGRDLIQTDRALFVIRDGGPVPAAPAFSQLEPYRALNPLAVLTDWRRADSVRVVARCTFRDYPRVVLDRGADGPRLYLDPKSGLPVKLERIEPNYLWGQVRAEYVYTTWWQTGPVVLPIATVRYQDGVEHLRRDVALPQAPGQQVGMAMARDSAPSLLAPPGADQRGTPDFFATAVPVDTVRVGSSTFLLRTPMYTHAVTLARDTVFLFDATTAEWRSRADSAWIARLFPGRHPIVLVVTDVAWPHIAGLRFWAARADRIVTHGLSRPMLTQVLQRSWRLTPDLLERARGRRVAPMVTTTVGRRFAGGAVLIRPIDGGASEGALMALVTADGFLWASDYIQTLEEPSLYAREVAAAVRRAGWAPRVFAAQHVGLNPWSKVESKSTAP